MDFRVAAIIEAKFWDTWYLNSEYRKRMSVIRKISGGNDPVFEGWLLFLGLDYCPWYNEEMNHYDIREI